MDKIALIFSGQGAQYSGMGQQLREYSPAARAVFEIADSLRPDTSRLCFNGNDEELMQTKNTQPCLFCVDLAAAAALREAGVEADLVAGFSLGELAALTYAEAMTTEEGFQLVCRRGELMRKAGEINKSSMAVVLKLQDEVVNCLCNQVDQVYPVNYNCPGQVVVSGVPDGLESLKGIVKEAKGKTMPLGVSGGFHCKFMQPAAERFRKELKEYAITSPKLPLYSNVTALPYYNDDPKEMLARQIICPVLWHKSIENMISAGATTFIEVGPGRVLSNFVSRISDQVRCCHVEDVESLKQTIAEVKYSA